MIEAPTVAQLRLMYDSANMDAIPADAQIVAGYPHRGGDTIWNPGRFPRALIMAIDQHGNHADDCHAADYENGALFGPYLIRQWVQSWHQLHPQGLAALNGMRLPAGWFGRPLVYCDESNLLAVRQALAGLLWDEWIAAWPGLGPVLQDGGVAHQYAGSATSGGDYDLSVVSAGFGARPVPADEPPGWQDQALQEVAAAGLAVSHLARLIQANTP